MVYVDQLQECPPQDPANKKWKYSHYCHLWADTIEELHQFAGSIKLKKAWFQDLPGFPHYDLTLRMRGAALANGALSAGRRELFDFVKRERQRTGVEKIKLL